MQNQERELSVPGSAEREDAAAIVWRYGPLRGRPAAGLFLLALFPALGAGVWLRTGNLLFGLLAAAFVALAISPALLPTRYEIGPAGVTVRHLGRTARNGWDDFRRLIVDADVLVLSPFERACFLDSFRGLYLRFNEDQAAVRERVLALAMASIPRHRGTGEGESDAARPR